MVVVTQPVATASYAERTKLTRQVSVPAYNDDNVTIAAGTPLYVREVDNGTYIVRKADASNPNKMPAIGVAETTFAPGETSELLIIGEVKNLNTFGTNAGRNIYVQTGSGGYTQTPPTSPSQIQPIGIISEEDFIVGRIFINGPMAEMSGGSSISASYALTASYAITSSHEVVHEQSSSYAQSASYALTASYALNAGSGGLTSGSIVTGSTIIDSVITSSTIIDTVITSSTIIDTVISSSTITDTIISSSTLVEVIGSGSFSGSFVGDGSQLTGITASIASTASYISSSNVDGPYGFDSIVSSSYAITASYALNGSGDSISASYALTASYLTGLVESASFATTASYVKMADAYKENFTNVTSITVAHNIGSSDVLVAVYETTGGTSPQLIIPQSVT